MATKKRATYAWGLMYGMKRAGVVRLDRICGGGGRQAGGGGGVQIALLLLECDACRAGARDFGQPHKQGK
jgi:hypothetical protein